MNGVATQKKSNQEQGEGTNCLPWYDSKEGLEAAAASLGALFQLQEERHVAGYKRRETLHNFYILGRYYTDSCGNFGKLDDYVPKEHFPQIPNVMTDVEMRSYLNAQLGEKAENIRLSWNIERFPLPPEHVTCQVCSKGWTIENCHDFVSRTKTCTAALGPFIGLPLSAVQAFYDARSDKIFTVRPEIRNDKNIDLSLRHPENKESKILNNEYGWLSQDDGINLNYIIQAGDEGYADATDCYHAQCNNHALLVEAEKQYKKIFHEAGFVSVYLRAVPNPYCREKNCTLCAPWFEVETGLGTIIFGFRKNVFDINWSKLQQPISDLHSLFEDENVTKDNTHIHAHSGKKAVEYLSLMRKKLIDVR